MRSLFFSLAWKGSTNICATSAIKHAYSNPERWKKPVDVNSHAAGGK